MEKEYIVKINHNPLEEDDYEIDGNNFISISIFDEEGNKINSRVNFVQLEFSRNGALGFGKELIRSYFKKKFDSLSHDHIHPIGSQNESQNMGVFVLEGSPELVIQYSNSLNNKNKQ